MLYCVTNGWMGESYVRAYVWAESEAEALELARKSFRDNAGSHPESWWTQLKIEKLFSHDAPPFATKPSDSGFNDDGY